MQVLLGPGAPLSQHSRPVLPLPKVIFTPKTAAGAINKRREKERIVFMVFFLFQIWPANRNMEIREKLRLELQEKRIQAINIAQKAVEEWVE